MIQARRKRQKIARRNLIDRAISFPQRIPLELQVQLPSRVLVPLDFPLVAGPLLSGTDQFRDLLVGAESPEASPETPWTAKLHFKSPETSYLNKVYILANKGKVFCHFTASVWA
jgi:hypothetical protein